MNTKEINNNKHSNKLSFWRANRLLFACLFLGILLIFTFCFVVLVPHPFQNNFKEDVSTHQTTSLFSIDKVVCYSSAYGISQDEKQGKWNLNLGQYTDIAIYLNCKDNISNIYIDNISFERSDIGNLSLSSLSSQDFAKSPIAKTEVSSINNTELLNIHTPERIDFSNDSPIFLRYLNHNFRENQLISDIENPLTFDGSLLKRGKVLLSSLKNTVSFTIHITNNTGNEFVFPIQIPINLENKEDGKSVYDGSYMEELQFSNASFYVK